MIDHNNIFLSAWNIEKYEYYNVGEWQIYFHVINHKEGKKDR